MKLNEMKATEGARFTSKRIGRGQGSGTGKTSGKGQKGQNSRSGKDLSRLGMGYRYRGDGCRQRQVYSGFKGTLRTGSPVG